MRLIALALFALGIQAQTKTVTFVCEHGSAKSVIAAAHFNRMAEQRGLPYRAISRGVQPDAEIPANIRSGLLSDGFKLDFAKPALISAGDIQRSERVVTLACELPKSFDRSKLVEWSNLPAVSDGYSEARAAIVARIDEMLTTLVKAQKR